VVGGFDIQVEVKDLNGNVRKATKHLDSFVEWVAGGVEDAWDWIIHQDVYYQLPGFPARYQGVFGLCAAYTCLEVAEWYNRPQWLLGVAGVQDLSQATTNYVWDGMYCSQETNYYSAIGVLQGTDASPTYSRLKQEIQGEKDPVVGNFQDFYNEGDTNSGW
jgi:hypothetical protein